MRTQKTWTCSGHNSDHVRSKSIYKISPKSVSNGSKTQEGSTYSFKEPSFQRMRRAAVDRMHSPLSIPSHRHMCVYCTSDSNVF